MLLLPPDNEPYTTETTIENARTDYPSAQECSYVAGERVCSRSPSRTMCGDVKRLKGLCFATGGETTSRTAVTKTTTKKKSGKTEVTTTTTKTRTKPDGKISTTTTRNTVVTNSDGKKESESQTCEGADCEGADGPDGEKDGDPKSVGGQDFYSPDGDMSYWNSNERF